MKKLLLHLLLFGTIVTASSQNILITQLSATSLTGGVNVNVQTVSGTGSGYLSNSHTISGNVIDLYVCYWFDQTLPILNFNNDFFIPLTNSDNYTINVHIILSSSQVTCDYYANTDNQSTSITYLSAEKFEKTKADFTFYPNPTNGNLEFKGNAYSINQIDIFDNLGRLVKHFDTVTSNSIDVNDLNEGIYFLKIKTENGNFNQKIIVKK